MDGPLAPSTLAVIAHRGRVSLEVVTSSPRAWVGGYVAESHAAGWEVQVPRVWVVLCPVSEVP